jgi:hypothetical protein
MHLINCPIIFISYPLGAGGTFLASMLQKALTPQVELVVDSKGSGHGNTYIRHAQGMYKDNLFSDIGKAIVNDTHYDRWSVKERIEHLQNNLIPVHFPTVISLHCANLDIFLQAYPTAKFICIDITTDQIKQCRFNTLYKAIRDNTTLLNGLTEKYKQDYNECVERLKNLNIENLEFFKWLDEEILFVSAKKKYELNNVLHISYSDYLEGDETLFLQSIFEFCNLDMTHFDEVLDGLVWYRLSQPRMPDE